MSRSRIVLAILAASVVVGVPVAVADTVTVPPEAGFPWTDPAHRGPLEVVTSSIASTIAGRPVSVRCEGETDWSTLSQQYGFDPRYELGYVSYFYYLASRAIVFDAPLAELSPQTCLALQDFAIAETKPTKCRADVVTTMTVYKKQRYRATVKVKLKGKWVTRVVWKTRRVPTTVTSHSLGDPAPCYLGAQNVLADQPDSYWDGYARAALAILVLAHESTHLAEVRAGVSLDAYTPGSETRANCFGLQRMRLVAERLGATGDDAQAIAMYAADSIYPHYAGVSYLGSPYWSADCRADGPLDLTPGDGSWP